MSGLAERFCAAISVKPVAGLDAALQAGLAHCRSTWPGIGEDDGFVEHLARRRFAGGALPEPFEAGRELPDLYLAWACGRGDPRALQLLEAEVLSEVGRTVARMKLPDSVLPDEIVQRVRERVLMPRSGAGPAILDYEGTGTLLNWLRTAAIREVVTQARKGQVPQEEEEALLDLPFPGHHPELALARARFRARFREAFAQAVAELPSEEKNLLKLNYLDGVTVDRIGALFGVNKSTISRRLAQTRDALLERTRALLEQSLDVKAAELNSLMRMMDSSLEVSIPTALFRDSRNK